MKIMKYLFFLGVIYLNMMPSTTNIIYTIIDGSLTDFWRFNFTIFAKDFSGVILHCFDSNNNQFEIAVKPGSNKNKYILINNKNKNIPFSKLCGCEECENKRLNLIIQSAKSVLIIICNKGSPTIFNLPQQNNNEGGEDPENINYPLPLSIVKTSKKIYIMMGNIGPYLGKDNKTVSAQKNQLIGCLESFYYNDTQITFLKEGDKMLPSCQSKCTNNMCNGGLCKESISLYNHIICDCSSTNFNGPFCNRSMKTYNKGGNNSYKIMKDIKKIYIKMTWKSVMLEDMYCLIEFAGEHSQYTTLINKSQLMVNNKIIFNIITEETNFINVNITHHSLTIKNNINESKINFTLMDIMRINVGYSDSNHTCKTFNGEYDLHYNVSKVQEDVKMKTYTPVGSIKNNDNAYGNETTKAVTDVSQLMSLVLIVTAIFIFIISILFVILYLKSRKEMKMQIQKITAMSTFSLAPSNGIFTETGIYGRVKDNDYDFIEERDIYDTISL